MSGPWEVSNFAPAASSRFAPQHSDGTGKRLLQPSTGYLHTFVSGVEIGRNGEPTGATPGRLVRGAQPQP